MTKRFNFNQLYYFWTIAREGSIKKAGKKLHLTASGLSGQLRQLEEFFGKKLFARSARRLVLNDTGQMVFDYATEIFNKSDEMVNAIRRESPRKQTLIRVGVLPSLSKSHVHEFILPLLRDKWVLVKVTEAPMDELIYLLDNQNVDIILSDRPPFSKKTRLKHFRLKPRKIIAVGTERFISIKKGFPQSLSGTPLIYLTEHCHLRSEIDDYFEQKEVQPHIVGEADDAVLLRLAAEKGICVAILPNNTVQESIASGRLFNLGELKGINSDMWAIMNSRGDSKEILEKTINRFIFQD